MSEVIYTNGIPQCPNCKVPTQRQSKGAMTTLMSYTPIYNEQGINTNLYTLTYVPIAVRRAVRTLLQVMP